MEKVLSNMLYVAKSQNNSARILTLIQGDGPDWICFRGEINILDSINLGSFKASGLSVKVCATPVYLLHPIIYIAIGLHRIIDDASGSR